MHFPRRFSFACCACALALIAPRTAAQGSVAERAADLSRFVAALAALDTFSGVVVLQSGDDVVLELAFGEASKRYRVRNTPATRFHIASAGKMLTAVAVARLIERGALRLDDRVGAVLDRGLAARVRDEVTVRHLLAHTSGLGDVFTERWWQRPRHELRSVADELALLADADPAFPPGTRFLYSNAGYVVLAAIVEKVTGLPWDRALASLVLEPAGMTHTGLFALDDPVPDVATGYTHQRLGDADPSQTSDRWWETTLVTPYRGVYATAGDMLAFMSALRSGKLLPAAAVERLTTGATSMADGSDAPRYGLGFIDATRDGVRAFGHDGDFHGISASILRFPESDETIAVLANYGDGVARQVTAHYWQLLAGTAAPALQVVRAPAGAAPRIDERPLAAGEGERYAEVARRLIAAINAEDDDAYRSLLAPEFLASRDDADPWGKQFRDEVANFGRIAKAWAPRSGSLDAGGARFAGHEGGVSVLVRFERAVSGTLTFSLDAQGRVCSGSCWFQRGFAERNVDAATEVIFELGR
jgi:CubicO group peptidase (beta-lactamase class C family)